MGPGEAKTFQTFCLHRTLVGMAVQKQVSEHHRIKELDCRPGQVLLSDARSRAFKEEARRQASLVAIQNREFDDQDFVEAVSVEWGDE